MIVLKLFMLFSVFLFSFAEEEGKNQNFLTSDSFEETEKKSNIIGYVFLVSTNRIRDQEKNKPLYFPNFLSIQPQINLELSSWKSEFG